MLRSLVIGIVFIVAVGVLWLVVQLLWKQVFTEEYQEDDVLAARRSCANCGCTTFCKRNLEKK